MPVLGMRGTGNFSADERPKNYRETILLLFPNTKAALTALMSKLKDRSVDDPEFKVFLKGLPNQRAVVSGSQTSGDTTIELQGTTPATIFRKGHAVLNERTLEVIWVTADPVSAFTSISVARGKGSTAAAMNDGDGLYIIGSSHQEGAPVPTAVTYDPTVINNYTQIHRTAINVTNTQKETNVRTGNDLKERQRESLELHGTEIEKALFFGTGVEDTSGAHPQRTTKGLLSWITTNVTDFADAVSIDAWENFLENVMKKGSRNKALMCGSRAVNVLNKLARAHYTIQATPQTETYGVSMTTWTTPFGDVQVMQHPLFTESPVFIDWGFVIDFDNIEYVYLRNRDTQYLEARQSPGDDATIDEWLTECGLGMEHEQTHGVFKNASAFVP